MTTQIFVNLPVANLESSKAFFEAIGFKPDAGFTDETAACMIIGDSINVMLLTHASFKAFSKKPMADAHKMTEVLNCLTLDSKARVDEMVDKAIAAGGKEVIGAPQNNDAMFMRAFDDLDGHNWEIMWMDENAMKNDAKS